jgi:hypothetical protein
MSNGTWLSQSSFFRVNKGKTLYFDHDSPT